METQMSFSAELRDNETTEVMMGTTLIIGSE